MPKDDLMKFRDLENLPTDTILRDTNPDERSEDCQNFLRIPFQIWVQITFPS